MEGAVTISTLLSTVGTVFAQCVTWVGNVATAITGNVVLELFCIAIPLVGLGVGMFKRLLRTRG